MYAVKYCLFNKEFSSFRYRYLIFGSTEFISVQQSYSSALSDEAFDSNLNLR
jgi:hypothetical protein